MAGMRRELSCLRRQLSFSVLGAASDSRHPSKQRGSLAEMFGGAAGGDGSGLVPSGDRRGEAPTTSGLSPPRRTWKRFCTTRGSVTRPRRATVRVELTPTAYRASFNAVRPDAAFPGLRPKAPVLYSRPATGDSTDVEARRAPQNVALSSPNTKRPPQS